MFRIVTVSLSYTVTILNIYRHYLVEEKWLTRNFLGVTICSFL